MQRFMKKQILVGLLSLAVLLPAFGRVDSSWVNNIVLSCPPETPPNIDALLFINNGIFSVDLINVGSSAPFATADTLSFTNNGIMDSATGFRLDNFDRASSSYRSAQFLHNEAGAVINCGGTNLTSLFSTNGIAFLSINSGAQLLTRAQTTVNHGSMEMGINGLLSISSDCSDLQGGLLNMEGFESGQEPGGQFLTFGAATTFAFQIPGQFDYFWGLGQNNNWFPGSSVGATFASSPSHWETNRYYVSGQTSIGMSFPQVYQNITPLGPSNNLIQVVAVHNIDPAISNIVYFNNGAGTMEVEWTWPWTNIITGDVIQDHLLLEDDIYSITNLLLTVNGTGPLSTGLRNTYIPTNYVFFRGISGFGTPATPGLSPGLINIGNSGKRETNDYTAYLAMFLPTTTIPSEVAGQSFTNMAGRIEVNANNQLDLTSSRIGGLNFVKLNSPKNFEMDDRTRILTYAADYNLGRTNGNLTFTNLIPPTCPRLNGFVQLYSARWTNVTQNPVVSPFPMDAFTTNIYTVLLVDSRITNSSRTILQNLALHSTNVIISDVVNVSSNLLIDAWNLTIATNGPDAQNPAGQLNFLSGRILWTNSLPNLHTLTNLGQISVQNAAFFGGVRFPPFSQVSSAEPYQSFVNHGKLLTLGAFVWANNFEDTGLLDGGPLSVTLQVGNATMTNDNVNAPNSTGDVSIYASNLFIRSNTLTAGRKLTIWPTNSINDGGSSSGNFWSAGVGGFNLLNKPPTASLLGTTLTETAPNFARVTSSWAGSDLGASPGGFANNAALGRLILDAKNSALLIFQRPNTSGNYALYVDYLELQESATNHDSSFNLTSVQINSGFKIYYGDAVFRNSDGTVVDESERLDHKNGGGLNWVPAFAGAFSGTNLVYPDGTTNFLSRALVLSKDIDSDGDGIVNYYDPTPILVPSMLTVRLTRTALPPSSRLTWDTIGLSTNYVYYKGSPSSTNWQLLTNFVFDPVYGQNGKAVVLDSATTNRFYRVRVDVRQP
jgi:hypothetical protein